MPRLDELQLDVLQAIRAAQHDGISTISFDEAGQARLTLFTSAEGVSEVLLDALIRPVQRDRGANQLYWARTLAALAGLERLGLVVRSATAQGLLPIGMMCRPRDHEWMMAFCRSPEDVPSITSDVKHLLSMPRKLAYYEIWLKAEKKWIHYKLQDPKRGRITKVETDRLSASLLTQGGYAAWSLTAEGLSAAPINTANGPYDRCEEWNANLPALEPPTRSKFREALEQFAGELRTSASVVGAVNGKNENDRPRAAGRKQSGEQRAQHCCADPDVPEGAGVKYGSAKKISEIYMNSQATIRNWASWFKMPRPKTCIKPPDGITVKFLLQGQYRLVDERPNDERPPEMRRSTNVAPNENRQRVLTGGIRKTP